MSWGKAKLKSLNGEINEGDQGKQEATETIPVGNWLRKTKHIILCYLRGFWTKFVFPMPLGRCKCPKRMKTELKLPEQKKR